jgi:hypothetical protein
VSGVKLIFKEKVSFNITINKDFRILFGKRKRVWRMGEACTGSWWGILKKRYHWGDSGVDGRIIIRWIFRKWDVGVWTGSGWLRIGTGGGHL